MLLHRSNFIEIEELIFKELDIADFQDSFETKRFKVKKVIYSAANFTPLSELALQNISWIKTNVLELHYASKVSEIIRVLHGLPKNMTVWFNWNYNEYYNLPIKFSNAFVQLNEEDELALIYWKEIWFSLSSIEKDAVILLNGLHIFINNFKKMRISNFEKQNFTSIFSPVTLHSDLKSKGFCIIPSDNLSEIRLGFNELRCFLLFNKNQENFPLLLSNTKVIIVWGVIDVIMLMKTSSCVPRHTELEIDGEIYNKF